MRAILDRLLTVFQTEIYSKNNLTDSSMFDARHLDLYIDPKDGPVKESEKTVSALETILAGNLEHDGGGSAAAAGGDIDDAAIDSIIDASSFVKPQPQFASYSQSFMI